MIRYMLSILGVLGVLVLPVQQVSAQALSEGMTMHRVGAGALDSSGWTDAVSTEGGFSVRLPIKFNDFTVRVPDAGKGAVSKVFAVGGKNTMGVKFVATRMAYRQKGQAQSFFAKFEKGEALKGATVKPHEFQGRRAADLVMIKGRSHAYIRVILLKDSVVMMTVEYPRAFKLFASKSKIDTFFASLSVTRP